MVFLLAYAAAQLVAGSKALHVLLDWPLWSGAIVGAVLVSLYCVAGGIRASIWTDAAQSFVMIFAMGLLLIVATQSLGGVHSAIDKMQQVDGFLNWFPSDLALPGVAGGVLFALSWMFAGFSVIGQPHIMVRFMALDDSSSMFKARVWYYSWFLIFYSMATLVGMLSRVYLTDTGSFDSELALPTMALELLPSMLVGLVLAGIFAATMSTADSLVLGCSASISHDLLPSKIERTLLLKVITVVVTLLALLWALSSKQTVFNMVIMAWSGMASAFVPILLVRVLGLKCTSSALIAGAIAGLSTAILWRVFGLQAWVYEGLPGILVGLVIVLTANQIVHGKSAPGSS